MNKISIKTGWEWYIGSPEGLGEGWGWCHLCRVNYLISDLKCGAWNSYIDKSKYTIDDIRQVCSYCYGILELLYDSSAEYREKNPRNTHSMNTKKKLD
jgi:hypothetical protein